MLARPVDPQLRPVAHALSRRTVQAAVRGALVHAERRGCGRGRAAVAQDGAREGGGLRRYSMLLTRRTPVGCPKLPYPRNSKAHKGDSVGHDRPSVQFSHVLDAPTGPLQHLGRPLGREYCQCYFIRKFRAEPIR